jgi:hypothetical protein
MNDEGGRMREFSSGKLKIENDWAPGSFSWTPNP